MKAEEFFKEEYGHSYNLPLDSIEAIKFATRYAAATHQEGGECYVEVDASKELPNEGVDVYIITKTKRRDVAMYTEGKWLDQRSFEVFPQWWLKKKPLPQISEGEIDKKIHSLVVKLQILFEAERGELGMLDMSKKGLAEAGRISDHYDDKKAAHIKVAITQLMKGGEG